MKAANEGRRPSSRPSVVSRLLQVLGHSSDPPPDPEPVDAAEDGSAGDGKPDPEEPADDEPVVLAKDGKNTIPYEKLVEARNEAKAAREEHARLVQEMESIKAALAEKQAGPKADEQDEEEDEEPVRKPRKEPVRKSGEQPVRKPDREAAGKAVPRKESKAPKASDPIKISEEDYQLHIDPIYFEEEKPLPQPDHVSPEDQNTKTQDLQKAMKKLGELQEEIERLKTEK